MVTFLDTGLFEFFSVIFPALLVFAVVYGFFTKFKIFGESKSLHAIIAISVAFLVMLSEDIVALISFIAPWFVLFFVFLMLLLMVYMIMGASADDFARVINNDPTISWTIFVIGIVIIAAGVAHVYGQRLGPLTQDGEVSDTDATISGETSDFSQNVGKILFHPKLIGMIFILLVAVFAIALLTKESV